MGVGVCGCGGASELGPGDNARQKMKWIGQMT